MSTALTVSGLLVGALAVAAVPTAYRMGTKLSACAQTIIDVAKVVEAHDQAGAGVQVMRSGDGLFYVVAEIDGQNVRLLLDSGASDLMISAKVAKRLGLVGDDLIFDDKILTIGREVPMARIVIKKIAVAGKTFENVPALVLANQSERGLMGQSLLRKFTRFEAEGDSLIIK